VPNDSGNIQWAPSSDALLTARRMDGAMNIWRLPIDDGPSSQLTRLEQCGWGRHGDRAVFD
jgi:hypothetical protein